ncbi:hypothetical protein PENTCL1PPCAC_10750, partial [Pristionchus entomophagus]
SAKFLRRSYPLVANSSTITAVRMNKANSFREEPIIDFEMRKFGLTESRESREDNWIRFALIILTITGFACVHIDFRIVLLTLSWLILLCFVWEGYYGGDELGFRIEDIAYYIYFAPNDTVVDVISSIKRSFPEFETFDIVISVKGENGMRKPAEGSKRMGDLNRGEFALMYRHLPA